MGIFKGIYMLTFNVSHQMLAQQYSKLSDDIPASIENEMVPEEKIKRKEALMKTLMVLNIVFPLVLPITLIRYALLVLDPAN